MAGRAGDFDVEPRFVKYRSVEAWQLDRVRLDMRAAAARPGMRTNFLKLARSGASKN
jgi:hypothetical protein